RDCRNDSGVLRRGKLRRSCRSWRVARGAAWRHRRSTSARRRNRLADGPRSAYHAPIADCRRFRMRLPVSALALAFALPAIAAAAQHTINVHDLVLMDRVGSPVLSPDGKTVAFTVRETDYAANKGVTGIWTVPLAGGSPERITDEAMSVSAPAWSADGKSLYFTAAKDGVGQLWRVAAG